MPGLYKPTSPCRKCADCTATPKRTCRQKIEQSVWVLRRRIKGISFQATTGCSDQRAAMDVAKTLIEDWEREAVGLPPKEKGRRRLDQALEKFEKHLRVGRGKKKQQRKVMRLLREVVEEARRVAALDFVDELSEEVYSDWLPYAEARNLANRTINDRIRVLKRFGKWLRATRRLPHDPFEVLVLLPDQEDLRQVRRALWPDESQALVRSGLRRQIEEELAKNAESRTPLTPGVVRRRAERLYGLCREGYYRALVYFTCLRTGLRKAEVKGVRVCDVQFDRKRIRVSPKVCKVRVEQYVQMDDDLARHLRSYIRRLGDVDDTTPLFAYRGSRVGDRAPTTWVPTMKTFDRDLVHAAIEKKDKSDRVVVFHSLRKSYITYLWMTADDNPKIQDQQDIQRLARHSDIKLTQQVYTDWEMLAGREWRAAERLAGWLKR